MSGFFSMSSSFFLFLPRRLLCLFLAFAICFAHSVPADAAVRKNQARSDNPRYGSIIMDAQTGQILKSRYADKRLYPASLTKMMTLFLTFEAIQRGRLHMNKTLRISQNAVNQPPTKLGVRPGDQFTVKQAILALITRSANDVAVVMAENIAGSEREFAKMMTKRAKSLGMNGTNFANASGLPNAAQFTTVRDMAILSRALMQYFPDYYPLFSTKSFVYKRELVTSHNRLMSSYEGMDGLKTGYINASGFNLAASAVKNNRRLIVVVFGGRTAASRDAHVAQLLNEGFAMLPRGQQNIQVATKSPDSLKPVVTAQQAVKVTPPAPQPTAPIAPIQTAPTQHVATVPQAVPQQPTPTTGNRGGWVPDGGQVRPLQVPQGYQQPSAPQTAQQQIVPIPSGTPAHTDQILSPTQPAQYRPSSEANTGWGIQVGAFMDSHAAQDALTQTQQRLGGLPSSARGAIVPAQTQHGMVYRVRILGLSAQAANQACAKLNECMIFTLR
jgi:D-alanyl-D-alanine carboxypeptidase